MIQCRVEEKIFFKLNSHINLFNLTFFFVSLGHRTLAIEISVNSHHNEEPALTRVRAYLVVIEILKLQASNFHAKLSNFDRLESVKSQLNLSFFLQIFILFLFEIFFSN